MKIYGGILAATLLVLMQLTVLPAGKAQAAACANVSTFGAVRLNVPTLPKPGEYALWVRLQSPETTGKILVEVNESDCLEISSSELEPNQWTWLPYSEDGAVKPIMLSSSDNNSLRVIGMNAGIKLDQLMLSEPGCVPEEFGGNCSASVQAVVEESAISLPPPSSDPVSGSIILSSTPERSAGKLKSVSYIVDGRTIQTFSAAEPFDTTLISNGKHVVLINTELQDGTVIKETAVIDVNNPQNTFSPVMRWLRLNKNSILVVGAAVAGSIILICLFWLARRRHLKKRERAFRGF